MGLIYLQGTLPPYRVPFWARIVEMAAALILMPWQSGWRRAGKE